MSNYLTLHGGEGEGKEAIRYASGETESRSKLEEKSLEAPPPPLLTNHSKKGVGEG
jgi:hypothetical protein